MIQNAASLSKCFAHVTNVIQISILYNEDGRAGHLLLIQRQCFMNATLYTEALIYVYQGPPFKVLSTVQVLIGIIPDLLLLKLPLRITYMIDVQLL